MSSCLRRRYPNIIDMHVYSPTFKLGVSAKAKNSRWINFWNYVGAREHKPSKYECEVCGDPVHVRKKRKYCVCKKCLHKYIVDVRCGRRKPVYLVRLVAA